MRLTVLGRTPFEVSNWTWDPVANAYYWHRFYSHQPDLNFDNPDVRDEMEDTVRYWLAQGFDGLRLDAVPYLYERDGTNGENLPETHAWLKTLRAVVDDEYEGQGAVYFTVVFNGEMVDVVHVGSPPQLFEAGVPVVLEGSFENGEVPAAASYAAGGTADDDMAATGIGREVEHQVRRIRFESESSAAATVELRYEYRDALVRLGVLPRPLARCEKPLARSVAEARRMLELAERSGLLHGYLENQLFSPGVVRGREIVWARGAALTGPPYLARAAEEHSGPHMPWFWEGELQGGGVLNDMMCHSVEVARFLLTPPDAPRGALTPEPWRRLPSSIFPTSSSKRS